jgi:hypothetical protein
MYQATNGGYSDAFLVRLNPGGTAVTYGSYLGGTGFDGSAEVGLDGLGNAYITGMVDGEFNATSGSYQPLPGGLTDGFVAKFAMIKLVFTTQPGDAQAGATFIPQPVVEVQDPAGNTLTNYSGTVSLTLNNGNGASLGGANRRPFWGSRPMVSEPALIGKPSSS